jgi:hypothetical protein
MSFLFIYFYKKNKTCSGMVIWERWKEMAKYEKNMWEKLERYAKIK